MNFANGKMSPFQSITGSVVVVDLLFIVAPDVCQGFVLCPCFVTQYLLSFLVLQSFR